MAAFHSVWNVVWEPEYLGVTTRVYNYRLRDGLSPASSDLQRHITKIN